MTRDEASYTIRKFYADSYKSNDYTRIEEALQTAVRALESNLTDVNKDIIEAGIQYTLEHKPMAIGGDNFEDVVKQFNRNPAFEAGGVYGYNLFFEKACDYLERALPLRPDDRDEFIEQFKETMKGDEL